MLIIGVALCLSILTGCGMPVLDRSLLTDEACAPPCWCGIIPGSTTHAESLVALSECPFVKKGTIEETPTRLARPVVVIGWDHRATPFSSRVARYNPNRAHAVDGTIVLLEIMVDYRLTLQQVVEHYGPPEGVYAVWGVTKPSYTVIFDYPGHGLSFKVFLPRADWREWLVPENRGVVRSDMEVTQVQYYAPSSLEVALRDVLLGFPERLERVLEDEQEWTGFGEVELAYYAR